MIIFYILNYKNVFFFLQLKNLLKESYKQYSKVYWLIIFEFESLKILERKNQIKNIHFVLERKIEKDK